MIIGLGLGVWPQGRGKGGPGVARFWRLDIADGGKPFHRLAEVELLSSAGVNQIPLGYVPTSSPSTGLLAVLTDRSLSSSWGGGAGGGGAVSIYLTSGDLPVTSLRLWIQDGTQGYAPSAGSLYQSVDGIAYTLAATFSGLTWSSGRLVNTITLPAP